MTNAPTTAMHTINAVGLDKGLFPREVATITVIAVAIIRPLDASSIEAKW